MVSKYHHKNNWILWLFLLPSLFVSGFILYVTFSENFNFTNIAGVIMCTIVTTYIFMVTVLRKPVILVTNNMIKYFYMNIRIKVIA